MYLIQYTAFLVLTFHQSIVNGFNIFDIDLGFNYLTREINSLDSPLVLHGKMKTHWILQEVDHFNSSDKRKWHMKYYEKLKYWRESGPIYIFLGCSNAFVANMAFKIWILKELAKETQGAMYCMGNRHYGDSKPFINLDTENIKYLSSRQALADTEKLILYLKSLPMYHNSKVVVVGGSYNGNLAAWMKVLYPKLIDAAISSNAPVLAKKDFYEFLHKVKVIYERYGGVGCINNITNKFENYDMLLQSPEGINKLKKDENICDECDMTVPENQQLFFWEKTETFMGVATFTTPDFIQFHCENLGAITDYRYFLNEHKKINTSYISKCASYDFNQYINTLHENRNFLYDYPKLYQACTEFGHFPTTTSKDQPFINIPLEFYIKICTGLFGNNFNEKRVDKGVEISNKLYGGLKPNVTNVVFTSGDMDTWSTMCVLEDLSHDAQAVVIPGELHALNIFSNENDGSDELIEARKLVKYLIRKWIGAGENLN